VDDETEILDYLSRLCAEIKGYKTEIYKAVSAAEAIAVFGKIHIDVVLSDIRMPGMDGLALAEAIRQKEPGCKIVFLTGYRDFNNVYQAVQKGNVRFLLKTESDTTILKALVEAMAELDQELRTEKVQENSTEKPDISRAGHVLRFLCHHINANLGGDLSLEALADLVRLNKSYLSRFFKEEMGINLSDYICEKRIGAAKHSLQNTHKRIEDIAREVGYLDGHSFSRLFRKVTGLSPVAYRTVNFQDRDGKSK
jgi:two-component system response regulator YesN